MELKEVPQGNDIRRHALDTDAGKVTAALATAAASHGCTAHQAVGIMVERTWPKPPRTS